MQYGRLIDSALQSRSERYMAEFLQNLRDVSVASRINRAIGDKMIMNAAFLAKRNEEQQLIAASRTSRRSSTRLTFKILGAVAFLQLGEHAAEARTRPGSTRQVRSGKSKVTLHFPLAPSDLMITSFIEWVLKPSPRLPKPR